MRSRPWRSTSGVGPQADDSLDDGGDDERGNHRQYEGDADGLELLMPEAAVSHQPGEAVFQAAPLVRLPLTSPVASRPVRNAPRVPPMAWTPKVSSASS